VDDQIGSRQLAPALLGDPAPSTRQMGVSDDSDPHFASLRRIRFAQEAGFRVTGVMSRFAN
jgi:hypothetical protein